MKTLLILKILEEYSNENNPLTQQQIIQYLKDNYNEDCDRRTVARRIKELSYLDDYDVVKCKKGTYLNKTFEDSDLRLLIDSILFSQNIGSNEVQRLIKKLRSLGDKDFKSKFNHALVSSLNPSKQRVLEEPGLSFRLVAQTQRLYQLSTWQVKPESQRRKRHRRFSRRSK